ncbi:TSUP family transporter [Nocardioides sp. IC4_145]|uniref:TSUP family transporter n=1 Tax=Nocardioides sp. IC4_145 TaxID=2714037 RepID=UPI00140D370E|nr:TSUP family transporter [Nocardioides sp. IC4_145]NHC21848.1 TSUP family transporter [Nocardioides sp. IC4_145]
MSADVLLWTAVVCLVASAAQAVTGFGFALVAVPALAAVTDPVRAVVVATLVGLALTTVSGARERAHVAAAPASRMVLGGLLGMPLGLVTLLHADEATLSLLICALVCLLATLLALRVRLPAGAGAQWGAGAVSGAMLTSTGLNGPPLVLLLQSTTLGPLRTRATLQVTFWCQELVAVGALLAVGRVDLELCVLAAAGALACPVGWRAGDAVFARIPEARFRPVVLVGLVAGAVASGLTVAL